MSSSDNTPIPVEYDMVFSLGANCSAAMQLKYHGLRRYSLPFDWTYVVKEEAFHFFLKGLRNHFSDFLHFENLREIDPQEIADPPRNKALLEDTATGYRFIHHFPKNVPNWDYDKVKRSFDKRVARLEQNLNESQKIYVLLASSFYMDDHWPAKLLEEFEEIFPEKKFFLHMLNFNCSREEHTKGEKFIISRYTRDVGRYDYVHTSYEWAFLDTLKLRKEKVPFIKKLVRCLRLKKGFSFSLFPTQRTLFCVSGYVLGLYFQFSIGQPRDIKQRSFT